MASTIDTLGALWNEVLSASKYWSAVAVKDGRYFHTDAERVELLASAYYHHCPRCLRTTTEDVGGEVFLCRGCGLLSACTYRVVRVRMREKIVRLAGPQPILARFGLVAEGLADTHPREFAAEATVIDLDHWLDFTNLNEAFTWEALGHGQT